MDNEKRLYLGIIIQALEDYVMDKPIGNKAESVIAKIDATNWFKYKTEDYQEICLCASIDYHWLSDKALNSNKEDILNLIKKFRQNA